jgi:putative membrane protein
VAEIPIQRKEGRNIWPMILGLLVLLAVLWFIFGRNRNADTSAARADSTAVASNGAVATDSAAGTTANGMASTSAANTGTGASNAALTDADIISVIHAVNQGEVDAGKLASTKASNADVKSFASEMVKDHQAMDAKGSKLASGAGSTAQNRLSDSVTSANQATSAQLQSAGSGAAFDKAYVDAQVTGHQNALAFLQRAENSAQSADLKKLITSVIPDVQKHLDRAKSLQSKVAQ